MPRKAALIKFYSRLVTRRRELLASIADDLQDLGHELGGRAGSDDLDAAADNTSEEVISQLAQLESRELSQIERAMARIRDGSYGSCEMCSKNIPAARLNALPYTTLCIECQREVEADPSLADTIDQTWQKVYDREAATREVTVKLSDLEMFG